MSQVQNYNDGGTPSTSYEPITRYVVDGGGTGDYTTIQDAINAGNAAGAYSFLIYMKPGIYTEDLTIPNKLITFEGTNVSSLTIIKGSHTVASDKIIFKGLIFQSDAGDVFTVSTGTLFYFENCSIGWSANSFIVASIRNVTAFFNYCGISTANLELASITTGKVNTYILNGTSAQCSISLLNGSYFFLERSTLNGALSLGSFCSGVIRYGRCLQTITSDSNNLEISKSILESPNDIAITITNQATCHLKDTIIDSGAANVITGDAGSTVYLDSVNFINSNGISTVTVAYEGEIRGNIIDMDLDVRGREMISDGDSGAGVAGTVQYTNTIDETLSTGNGAVLMKTANPGNSSGWLKVFANGNVRYIPYWTNISP